MDDSGAAYREIHYSARDGLKLYGCMYPATTEEGRSRRPVLCLAGLTRNSRDFHYLASNISSDPACTRNIFALDYRGRGQSAFDRNWRNYALQIELFDILDFMTMRGLHKAIVIGTSRGGLLAMLMGAAQPTTLGGVILNDIGPVIETEGLARIAGYVGRTPTPHTWDEAADILKRHNKAHFPNLTDAEWTVVAKQWFNDDDGKPAAGYDKNLSRALAALKGKIPDLWPQFQALKHVPLLVLRGENSDILSEATTDEMLRRHPNAVDFTVAEQGHAPLLRDLPTCDAIKTFMIETEPV